jgi:hypothetical protein
MGTDQELFAKGLATYQKVVRHNYMAHREVYGLVRDVIISEAPKQFVFLDIACGTATGAAGALQGTNVAGYIGVDISQPSLEVASEELKNLSCPVDLRRQFRRSDQRMEGTGSCHMDWPVSSPSPAEREARLHPTHSRNSSARRYLPDLGAYLS